ncbi:MAG: aromatic ring-hydroxylating dioxygenase subunit alpha, partial [Sphingobium sp.]
YRNSAGSPVAMEDRRVHHLAPLSLGRIEEAGIRCMYHGLLFADDGTCREISGQDRIPAKARVRVFLVIERDGWIWVWPGDPQLADEALLPRTVAAHHPEWLNAQNSLDYQANFRLLVDNLLDFSHLPFVHGQSFRADPKWATVRPSVKRQPRGLRIERWITDAPALASAREMAGQICDTWQGYDFLVPGVLVIETYYCKVGSAERASYGRPDSSDIVVRNGATQAVTAMTPTTSRYFYATSVPPEGADQAMADRILQVSAEAFVEDKMMIEAQQQRIIQSPSIEVMPSAGDNAIVMFHAYLREFGTKRQQASPSDTALT